MSMEVFSDYPVDTDDLGDFDFSSSFTGPCGDTIEFFMKINNGVIEKIAFRVKGCWATSACGEAVCRLSEGKSVDEVKKLKVEDIIKEVGDLPPDKRHCAQLAEAAFKLALELTSGK